jgi:hypothetical protein
MAKALFHGGLNRDINHAVGFSAWASPGIIFNEDATAVQSYHFDPVSVLAGTGTNTGEVRPVVVPCAYYYLNLAVGWTGTSVTTCTSPVVRVYGLLPREQKQARAYPNDISGPDYPDFKTETQGAPSWWVPLVPEGAVTPNITLASVTSMRVTLAGKHWFTGLSTSLYLAGVRQLLVTVKTASVVTEHGEAGNSSESSASQDSLESATTEGACIWGWMSG